MSNLNELSDAELSAVFAVEVAGWGIHCRNTTCWVLKENVNKVSRGSICFVGEEGFATSMDAVLPYFAARDEYCEIRYGHGLWVCFIGPNEMGVSSYDPSPKALKTTLPRAACIALILAARAEKEAAK